MRDEGAREATRIAISSMLAGDQEKSLEAAVKLIGQAQPTGSLRKPGL